jgi:F-type H+-transporting ATPase subunit epsilon
VAHDSFRVEVLTPEGEVFADDVEMISTRTTVGSIGILAHHQPLLGMLDPTELRLYKSESDVVRFAQAEGYVQVSSDRVLVLVEEAIAADAIDTTEQQEKLARAEQELASCEEGTEGWRVAAAAKRRAEVFLAIAGGGSDH